MGTGLMQYVSNSVALDVQTCVNPGVMHCQLVAVTGIMCGLVAFAVMILR
jgi:hypothetical protein